MEKAGAACNPTHNDTQGAQTIRINQIFVIHKTITMQTNVPPFGHPIGSSLLRKIDQQINDHLTDSDFKVSKLLRAVGISRTDLHRKLTRMTGMSATEYIRHKRLQHAQKLLLEAPEWSIGQIAFEVGFNSQSYFTRAFIEVYGECPTCYRRMHNGENDEMEHGCKKMEHP